MPSRPVPIPLPKPGPPVAPLPVPIGDQGNRYIGRNFQYTGSDDGGEGGGFQPPPPHSSAPSIPQFQAHPYLQGTLIIRAIPTEVLTIRMGEITAPHNHPTLPKNKFGGGMQAYY